MSINGEHTHNFHPYPAKFPSHAIRDLILDNTQEGDTVLDPFCGSGTTLVECRILRRNAIGIDLNPVGCLISKAKSAHYDLSHIEQLGRVYEELSEKAFNVQQWTSNYATSEILPFHPNKEHWFMPHVMEELYALNQFICESTLDDTTMDLMKMAFSRIIVPVSNQDSETRYTAIKKDIAVGDTLRLYLQTISDYKNKLIKSHNLSHPDVDISVIEGDTLEELNNIPSESVKYIITSPPYINSFDYYLYHKHRIYWLGGDPRNVRKREIGGHHTVDSQSYYEALDNYSNSMKFLFQKCFQILKPRGFFTMLIGDGIVKNRKIDMGNLIKGIALDSGYDLVHSDSTDLRNVSSRFIKGKNIERKKHHVITIQKPDA